MWYHNNRFVQLNNYKATGKILVFPISGHGKGNVTMTNVHVRNFMKYSLVTDPETKAKLVKVESFEVKSKFGKVYMNFENLYNGDVYLSKYIVCQ